MILEIIYTYNIISSNPYKFESHCIRIKKGNLWNFRSGLPIKSLRELHNIAYSTFQRSELRLAQIDQKRPSFEYLIKSSESSSFPSKDKAATSSLPRRTERWKIQQCLPAFSNSENHHLVILYSSFKIFFKILLKTPVGWLKSLCRCLHQLPSPERTTNYNNRCVIVQQQMVLYP